MSACTCATLRQLSRKVTHIYDQYLAENAISIGQYALLSNVARSGPIGLIPLAELMGLERSTLSRTIKPLIAAGWLVTVDLPLSDQRSKRSFGLRLTPLGQQKRNECIPNWQKAQRHIEVILGQQQHTRLTTVLEQANKRLDVNIDQQLEGRSFKP